LLQEEVEIEYIASQNDVLKREEIAMETTISEEKLASAKTLTTVIYALYAASLLVGVTSIIAIVMNYVKKDDVAGTWIESHFRWQIRTFWFGLLWLIIGTITYVVLIGWLVLAAAYIWFIYRVVKGWLNLNDNKPMLDKHKEQAMSQEKDLFGKRQGSKITGTICIVLAVIAFLWVQSHAPGCLECVRELREGSSSY